MLPYILVFATLILLIIILFYYKSESNNESKKKIITSPSLTGKPCPICQWPLQKNERVHSVIYRGKTDTIMHIFGCPYCYKNHPKQSYDSTTKRTCPACHKPLADGEYAIARLFEKPGKNHVHVLGCFRCRGKR